MDLDSLKKLNEIKNRIYKPRIAEIAKSTLCFFTDDKKQESKPVGCGIFLKIKNEHYIVTAAHVLAEFLDSTYIIMENRAIVIGGRAISSEMPKNGSRDDDKIDLTVIKMDEVTVNEVLKWYTPIDESEILKSHKIENSPKYFFYGYPLTRTKKKWGKDEIKSIGHAYQSQPASGFDFNRFGFNNKTHFAMLYDGGVTSASNPNKHLSPDLTGISGSGLWYFFEKDKKALLGIVIERINQTGNKALISTKIKTVLRMIKKF